MKLNLPSWLSVALSVLAGVLGGLNAVVLNLGEPWSTLATAGLALLAGLGVAPLVHGRLAVLLHVPYPVALAVAGALSTSAVALSAVSMNPTVRASLIGVITGIAGMLAGPTAPAASSGIDGSALSLRKVVPVPTKPDPAPPSPPAPQEDPSDYPPVE